MKNENTIGAMPNSSLTIYVNRQNSFFRFLNQIFLLSFCIWLAIPYIFNNTGNYFGVVLFILWLFTTNYTWLVKKWSKDLIFIAVFFITFLPYVITGAFKWGTLNPMSIFGAIVLFFIGIFINHYFMYYKKDYIALGRIALVSIIAFFIGTVISYIGYLQYPNVGRSAVMSDELYVSIGMGGYGYVFASVFIVIGFSFFLSREGRSQVKPIVKLFFIIAVFILLLHMIMASYATSLIFVFIGLLVVFLKTSFITNIFLMTLLLGLFVFAHDFVGEMFFALGELLENNQDLQEKAVEFGYIFTEGGEEEVTQLPYRLELYKRSFITFLNNPLFGIYGPFGETGPVGGHAGWLDVMARYGLFTVVPMFLAIYYNIKKHLLFFKNSYYYKWFFVSAILFILLGFVKSQFYVFGIGLGFFLIVPAVPFLPYVFKKREDIVHETIKNKGIKDN